MIRWKSVYLLKLQDSYLMHTHASYVPVNSAYVSMLVSELIRAEQSFLKPLRYDAGEAPNVTDFVLLDGAGEVPMKIYGYHAYGTACRASPQKAQKNNDLKG